MVRCGFHNHKLYEDLDGHDVLGRLKFYERQFVNGMMKYNMILWYIVSTLKDKDSGNLTSVTQVYNARATYNVSKRGFPYSEDERRENFKWTLEKLKELISLEKFLPNIMVMDRELALMKAIKVVFPNSTHYVIETWLTPYKERFVAAWTNIITHLCNTTMNRVESAYWRLKNMLTTSKGDLYRSWDVVNTMLKLQLGSIRVSFQKSIDNIEHRYNTPFYTNLHGFVSRKFIHHIRKKLQRVKYIGTSKYACGCFIRIRYGLPCACQLVGFQIQGKLVPLDPIHVFWKKLHIEEHGVNHEDTGTKLDLEAECEELKTYFNSLDIVGQKVLKKKVMKLKHPSTTLMYPPSVKYKPKGGVKKSGKGEASDVHHDPSQWKYGEGSQGSQTTKKSCTKPIGSQTSSLPSQSQSATVSSRHLYLSLFLGFLHPCIDDIIDMGDDGNYGFQDIVTLLG
ncbi:uncharacterized protein LOC127080822 [Lathyrus oleraceus]|uniref:uncharacterized protein LOC127080822 n=1 Tax=Pisum sativum TaxID=3888 RepID=UPI0021D026BB|nr:uncharacterized protein LOC127080822 [Pisum sativum]